MLPFFSLKTYPFPWYLDALPGHPYPFYTGRKMFKNMKNLMPLDRCANDIHVIVKTSHLCQRPRWSNQYNIARKDSHVIIIIPDQKISASP